MALRAARRGVGNLRVARMDARTLVNLMLPAGSLSACHVYFPDPWLTLSQQKHRMFSAGFAERLKRVLAPGAIVHVATDVEPYAMEMFAMLAGVGLAILVFGILDVYRWRPDEGFRRDIGRVFTGWFVLLGGLVFLLYATKTGSEFSRQWFGVWAVAAVLVAPKRD